MARLARRTAAEFLDDRCPQLAAAIAYYALFAVFPLSILLVAGFGRVAGEETARREVTELVLDNVPLRSTEGRQEIADALDRVTAGAETFGVLGLAGLVFSASGLMGALRYALSRAFDVDEPRPALIGKLLDIALVLAVGVIVAASLVLTVIERLADAVLPPVVLTLGQALPFLLTAAVFGFLYRFLPAREVRWRECLPGALLAAGGYEALKAGFALYLSNLSSFGAVYGSIATVIAFAFFVFVAANIFLLGAELTAEWPRRHEDARRAGPAARSPLAR